MKKQKAQRLSSGISGLDTMLQGGFLSGKNILLCGPSGAGKTTLACHFLIEGCMKNDEASLYITLEQPKKKIYEDMASVGHDLHLAETSNNFHVIGGPVANIGSYMREINAKPGHIIAEVEEVVKKSNIKRVVIDSVNLLSMLHDTQHKKRELIAKICNILSHNGCTTLLLHEIQDGVQQVSENGIEEFIVDGVIILYHFAQGSKFIPGIAIRKMRGTDHERDIRPYKITSKGLTVYPQEVLFVSSDSKG